jgi:hypothetical protein
LGEHVLEALQNPVLVAESDGVLLLVGVLEDSLDFFVDEDELSSLFWKLFLHFVGAQEQVLKISPIALHLR